MKRRLFLKMAALCMAVVTVMTGCGSSETGESSQGADAVQEEGSAVSDAGRKTGRKGRKKKL